MATATTDPIAELVARWAEPGGIPFKGSLITTDANGECAMCSQGQALYYVGGYSIEDLRNVAQSKADADTAKVLGISRAHAVLLRNINDGRPGAPSVVLTDPEQVLGDQAHVVLAFWRHLDTMTAKDWAAAWDAAGAAAGDAAGAAAWVAARVAARVAAGATSEIQGAAVLRERGKAFFFLPAFGFADPEALMQAYPPANRAVSA